MSLVAAAASSPRTGGLLFFVAILAFYIAAGWKILAKAGEPGWGMLVPIYNLSLICKVAGRPEWWLILFFIPLVNVVMWLIVSMDIAKAFSKGPGFGIGLWLLTPVFVPVLGFGSSTYTRPPSSGLTYITM